MSIKNTVAIAAAAGALAAISVPALALENEFHGVFQFKGFLSNFDKGDPSIRTPNSLKKENQPNNYFEQRARLQYIAKASDDLKLVTQFEIDSRFGGITDTTGKYVGSSDAGVLDADGINFETKHVYLDFNVKSTNVKLGIQPIRDSLKGVFVDADVPGVNTTTKLGNLTLGAGYFRYFDTEQKNTTTIRLGDLSTDLFTLDATYAVSKDIKAGLSYYFLADYGLVDQPRLVHTFGLNGEAKVGPATVSAFAAMQAGNQKNTAPNKTLTNSQNPVLGTKTTGTNTGFHGWAANVAAKMAVGPGTAKTAALYLSGDDKIDNQDNGWVAVLNTYNESGLMLLARNTASGGTTTDAFIVGRNGTTRGFNNVFLYTLGYDAKITPKAFANANVGFGWRAKNAGSPVDVKSGKANATNFIGTELNLETGYRVYDNLTAKIQAAYVILGGQYKGSAAGSPAGVAEDPENPYTARIQLTYAF